MTRATVYVAAGLSVLEVLEVETSLRGDEVDEAMFECAIGKLQEYYNEEIPYAIQSQSLHSPENTCTPDEWIHDRSRNMRNV